MDVEVKSFWMAPRLYLLALLYLQAKQLLVLTGRPFIGEQTGQLWPLGIDERRCETGDLWEGH